MEKIKTNQEEINGTGVHVGKYHGSHGGINLRRGIYQCHKTGIIGETGIRIDQLFHLNSYFVLMTAAIYRKLVLHFQTYFFIGKWN